MGDHKERARTDDVNVKSFSSHSAKSTHVGLKQPEKAVWNRPERRYRRHSVERDVQEFVGWSTMMRLIEIPRSLFLRGLVSALFLTGGRISEVLSLRKENFVYPQNEGIILVKGKRLVKRYRKIDAYVECRNCGSRNERWNKACVNCGLDLVKFGRNRWVTEKINAVRIPFPISMSEPYAPYLLRYVAHVEDYLFLNPYTQKPYTRSWAYSQVRELGKQIVPPMELYGHWFRAQRACMQLIKKHGYRDLSELGRYLFQKWYEEHREE